MQRDRQHSPSSGRTKRSAKERQATSGGTKQKGRGDGPAIVLVVDDDPDIRHAVRAILEEAGYATLEASHGREALELLQRAEVKPDLVLLDLMMPMMDGWQLRARLLEDHALASLPIVIMTAHGGLLRAVANTRPATPVLSKPIDVDRLLELVATYCKEKPPHVH